MPDQHDFQKKGAANRPLAKLSWQLAIVVVFLLSWQYLPLVQLFSRHINLLNRFYVSSPTAVAKTIYYMAIGTHGMPFVWPYLEITVVSTILGTTIGLIFGVLMGLIFSNSPNLSSVARPFVMLMNSLPRIAMIPIFILLFGPTIMASATNVSISVFFIAFFNAFEGGTTIKEAVIENVMLLGATRFQIMAYVRLPMIISWTFAAIPNAIAFGLAVAVATELMAGIPGIGYLLLTATSNVEAALTFALIIVLSVVGLILYWIATWSRSRVLRWQDK